MIIIILFAMESQRSWINFQNVARSGHDDHMHKNREIRRKT